MEVLNILLFAIAMCSTLTSSQNTKEKWLSKLVPLAEDGDLIVISSGQDNIADIFKRAPSSNPTTLITIKDGESLTEKLMNLFMMRKWRRPLIVLPEERKSEIKVLSFNT